MFERLRDAIQAALDAAGGDDDTVMSRMREAVIEVRTSIGRMQEGVAETQRRVEQERVQLADAERRGRLAAGIQDTETVEVAERFAAKHQERLHVLERKLEAQRSELALAEREYGEMKAQLLEVERRRPLNGASRRVDSAWRSVEAAGGSRPETDTDDALLRSQLDRASRERRAEEQLEELKKRMRNRQG